MLRAIAHDLKEDIKAESRTLAILAAVILGMLFVSVVVGAYLGFPTAAVFLGGYFANDIFRQIQKRT